MKIPFNNLEAQYTNIQAEINEAIQSAIGSFQFVRGPAVTAFENEFAKALQAKHCINTANGTDALFISLKSLNIKPADEVITPAFSWVSSAETISLCGAKPVFVDVDPQTYTIDPGLIEAAITPRTRAVVVVHLYGQVAHVSAIKKICEKHKLFLVEDCAQAHLSKEDGRYAGTIGDVGTFSFYPTKNLGAFGDGGCIVTTDNILAERIRRISNHGALDKDDHQIEGLNSRLDTIQAAILSAKLPHLHRWNEIRRKNASVYKSYLSSIPDIVLPVERSGTYHTYHLFVIRCQQRNKLKSHLETQGIQTIIHYPKALINLPFYHSKTQSIPFPISTSLQEEVLSLPINPELTIEEIEFVCENIKEFYRK